MNINTLKLQRLLPYTVLPTSNIVFENICENLGQDIDYNQSNGIITINKNGIYYIVWSVLVDNCYFRYEDIELGLVLENGDIIKGEYNSGTSKVMGYYIINVKDYPLSIMLKNISNYSLVIFKKEAKVKAALGIVDLTDIGAGVNLQSIEENKLSVESIREDIISIQSVGLTNLVNGKANGSVRGVNTAKESEVYSLGINAVAFGNATKAGGKASYAEGDRTEASGEGSHAEGRGVLASGEYSHAEGYFTKATGPISHAEGSSTVASGQYSHAEGEDTNAIGPVCHAEGYRTTASNLMAHAEGRDSIAYATGSHAEGKSTNANGEYSHAEGVESKTEGEVAHAEGYKTISSARASHAEGEETKALGNFSHAEGFKTIASAEASHTEGKETEAKAIGAHAEGNYSVASGDYSHAEGQETKAKGAASHAEGYRTVAEGEYSHAEGVDTTASGVSSHAEGIATEASGGYSHAEGYESKSTGSISHAEGASTIASGNASHAQGNNTEASGEYSHTEGYLTKALSTCSHAQGIGSVADGINSFAAGAWTITDKVEGAFIIGKYGKPSGGSNNNISPEYGFFLANGQNDTNLSLAAKILNNGDMYIDGKYFSNGADYAEIFESSNGKSIDVGYFVTFDKDDKIRKANATDDYILGVVSSNPSIIANAEEFGWKDKYIKDEWGRIQYDDKAERILNPNWNKNEEYIPRLSREEWVVVGLLGKILARDNGECKVGEYCQVSDEGIAVPAKEDYGNYKIVEGNKIVINDLYKVIARTGENQILILFR